MDGFFQVTHSSLLTLEGECLVWMKECLTGKFSSIFRDKHDHDVYYEFS